MIVYRCAGCEHEWPAKYVTGWGRDGAGDGYGPRPICTHLVPNAYAAKCSDGSTPEQVCGGQLIPLFVPIPA
jgi:hypothetical protein